MTRLRVDRVALLLALIGAVTVTAASQAKRLSGGKLEVEVIPPIPAFRSGGPVPITVKIRWTGSRVLEGPLDFSVRDPGGLLGRLRTGDVAVGTGDQTFGVLLPAMTATSNQSRPRMTARFGPNDLGNFPLNLPSNERRSLVVGFCRSRASVRPESNRIVPGLFLEQFDPLGRQSARLDGKRPVGPAPLASRRARLWPDELPSTPLEYCAFDVMVTDAGGFAELGERQLETLARWVEGGGSFLLLAERFGRLGSHHVRFLNRLTGGDSLVYRLGPDGGLVCERGDSNGLFLHRPELGRAVVVIRTIDPEKDLNTRWWREAVCFLWKVRKRSASEVNRTGWWTTPADDSRPAWKQSGVRPKGYSFLPLAVDLSDLTLPPEIQLIPFGVLLLILVLFILAIGPIDYYLLGLLRVRWLTWIVFPLTCVAFTLITVWVANAYLGGSTHRQVLTFVDVGRDGTPLRQSRVTLMFSGDEFIETTALDRTLYAALAPKRYNDSRTMVGSPWAVNPTDEGAPVSYVGRLAGRAEARRRIWKWTPSVSRTLTFKPEAAPLPLDWEAIQPETFWTAPLPTGKALERELESRGVKLKDIVLILALSAEGRQEIRTRRLLTASREGRGMTTKKLQSLIEAISRRREPRGFFRVVSAISPNGAGNFEDLAVLDDSDEKQFLLVVVKQEGEEFLVYRRLYGGE